MQEIAILVSIALVLTIAIRAFEKKERNRVTSPWKKFGDLN